MIFTDKFVYVHQPKTGGTFVTTALFRLYGVRWNWWAHLVTIVRKQLVRKHARFGTLILNDRKHGTCGEIPPEHRHKPILATVRNPFDWWVSQYEFGWWKRKECQPYFRAVPGFAADYPHFPALGFPEYVRLANAAFGGPTPRIGAESLGLYSRELVKYYCRAAPESGAAAGNDPALAAKCRAGLHENLHFILMDNLNQELVRFLVEMGYPPEDVAFVQGLGKIRPPGSVRRDEQRWQKYYTPEFKQEMRASERLAFTLFPVFDV